ncbi:MAG: CRISPR-associated endonuclease Cas1 [Deltaproteobacteria bacterium]|nr:MAG: CRISPR-associated endonuclease Cas1 [Deltaproteobacteria bacterium]
MEALFEKVCSLPTLMDAWKRIRAKGARGGLDRMTVKDFEADIAGNIRKLLDDLTSGRYMPEPLERINAPKMNGSRETRPLSLPSIRDKIAQQAVRTVIEPLFESVFLDCSYAYRAGKGPRKVFKRVNYYLTTEKRRFVALADFDRFFDSLNQDILLGEVGKLVTDPGIIRLIRMWCRIGFVDTKARYFDMDTGIGQGSVISPLLSNIYAHRLDEYMVQNDYAYVRYSDNIIVLSSSSKEAEDAFNNLTVFARKALKLSLNKNPSPMRSLEHGFVFLGIYYQGATREISRGKMVKIMRKLGAVIRAGKNQAGLLMDRLNRSLEGVRRYYSVVDPEHQMIEIDAFVVQNITPVIAGYIKQDRYRNIKELLAFLHSLGFVSKTYETRKESVLRELAGEAFKKASLKGEEKKPAAPSKKPFKREVASADRAVSRRKWKYLKTEGLSSELVVSTHGAFLGKRGNRVVISSRGKTLLSNRLDRTRTILVASKGVTLSSDLVHECSDNKIPIFFADAHGPPYAMVHLPSFFHARIGIAQLEARQNGQGTGIAKSIVIGKIRNQLNLMKFYGRSRKDDEQFQKKLKAMETEIEELIVMTKEMSGKGKRRKTRDRLFSIEGRAASTYWELVKLLIADGVSFPGRVRKGAGDLANSVLNYGYGILYARVWRAVTLAGLNPYLSFLHEPQQNRPALIFDMIEEFRSQAVDRAVFTMITRGEELGLDTKTGLLTEKTRKKVIQNVLERLASIVPYRGKRIGLGEVIRFQPGHLADCLENKKKYRPFVGRY